jgi:hypothetical protein
VNLLTTFLGAALYFPFTAVAACSRATRGGTVMKLVTQFNNNAEFAQIGDVTISTKSSGDQFHGSAFEYVQNDALDAEFWNFGNKPHKAFNTVPGPSRMLSKTFHLTERMRLRFKSTFTNLFTTRISPRLRQT